MGLREIGVNTRNWVGQDTIGYWALCHRRTNKICEWEFNIKVVEKKRCQMNEFKLS